MTPRSGWNISAAVKTWSNWQQLGEYQYQCLKAGLNGVGIPDLIITQNAIQHRCEIYTLDKHFTLLAEITGTRVIC